MLLAAWWKCFFLIFISLCIMYKNAIDLSKEVSAHSIVVPVTNVNILHHRPLLPTHVSLWLWVDWKWMPFSLTIARRRLYYLTITAMKMGMTHAQLVCLLPESIDQFSECCQGYSWKCISQLVEEFCQIQQPTSFQHKGSTCSHQVDVLLTVAVQVILHIGRCDFGWAAGCCAVRVMMGHQEHYFFTIAIMTWAIFSLLIMECPL